MPRSSQTWMSQQIHSKVWLCKAQRNGQIPGATSVTQQVSVFMINVKVHNSTNLKKKKKKLNTHGSFGGVAREKPFFLLSSKGCCEIMDQQDQSGDPIMHSATFGKPNTAHQLKQLTTGSVMVWVWSEFQIAVNRESADGKKKTLLQNQKCQIQLTFAAPHMDKQTKFYGHMRQRFSNLATILGRTFGGWMWGFQN